MRMTLICNYVAASTDFCGPGLKGLGSDAHWAGVRLALEPGLASLQIGMIPINMYVARLLSADLVAIRPGAVRARGFPQEQS